MEVAVGLSGMTDSRLSLVKAVQLTRIQISTCFNFLWEELPTRRNAGVAKLGCWRTSSHFSPSGHSEAELALKPKRCGCRCGPCEDVGRSQGKERLQFSTSVCVNVLRNSLVGWRESVMLMDMDIGSVDQWRGERILEQTRR